MCIIFVTSKASDTNIKFALAMNRDESFERKTEALQYWPELKVYCGRDLERGGTWLAINQKGWFVGITNIKIAGHNTYASDPLKSRGQIPLILLSQSEFDPIKWKQLLMESEFKNFNCVFGDLKDEIVQVYAFSSESRELLHVINDGVEVYSLSNGSIHSKWPKQEKGKMMMLSTDLNSKNLFSILMDSEIFCDGDNFNEDFSTWPIFIKPHQQRGTVSSSIILVSHQGHVEFVEKSWSPTQELLNEFAISFDFY